MSSFKDVQYQSRARGYVGQTRAALAVSYSVHVTCAVFRTSSAYNAHVRDCNISPTIDFVQISINVD